MSYMDKNKVIKDIHRETLEIRKKILAIRKFYIEIQKINILNFELDDKITSVLFMNFSFYEKFIKKVYKIIFNYINFLKKNKNNYPLEFDYLGFIYPKLGNKKQRLKQLDIFNNKEYLEHFDMNNFLNDNQKLLSIKELVNLHLLILNESLETSELERFLVVDEKNIDKDNKLKLENRLKYLSELYILRNDRTHGSYEKDFGDNVEEIFDSFLFAINVLSNLMIDILEKKF